ncbi:MAG: Fic family protein [Saprospiraceae bacterium]|nr:Fic family protein [Saprospiraceae bacterium]
MERKLKFDLQTTQKLLAATARIDQFKGKWEHIEQKDNRYLKELRTIATVQSIGSSTRIEGSTLSNAEVESLLKDMKITKFKTRDEQEVAGYYEALELILDQYEFIELSITNIKTLHNLLMKHSDKDQQHKGNFKQFTNRVVATYPDGTVRTIFNTTEPFLVEKEMEASVEWANRELANRDFHSLICIGTFIYEFLSIHPFQDGNGRLSRLLTTLLLLRAGYGFVQYISFENIVELNKKDYYRSLMAGQQNRYSEDEIIGEWMYFFLKSLEELTQKLDEKYSRYLNLGGYLNQRQQALLDLVRERKLVRLEDAIELYPDISRRTLQRDFGLLESERLVERTGKGRAVAYGIVS